MNAIRSFIPIGLILPAMVFMTSSFIFSTPKRNTIFYIALAISLPFILSQHKLLKKIVRDPLFLTLSALLCWIAITSMWGNPELLPKAFKYSLYILVYYVSLLCYFHREPMAPFLKNLTIAYCGAALFSTLCWVGIEVAQFYQGNASIIFSGGRWNHILHDFQDGNPIRTSSYFFLAALFVLIESKSITLDKKHLVFAMLFVVWVILGLAGQSRAPLIGFLLCIALLVMYHQRHYLKCINYKLIAVIVIGLLVAIIFIYKGLSIRSDSPFHRLQIWFDAFEQIQNNFWFGLGYGSTEGLSFDDGELTASYSHNFIIELLRISGFIGFLLYLLFCVLIAINYYKSRSFPPILLSIWFIFGFICMLAIGDILLDRPSSDWLLFWTPISLLAIDSTIRCQQL